MAKLPTSLSGRDIARVLRAAGFTFDRQRGSHMVYIRQIPPARVTVPNHDPVRVGTLRAIIRQAGMTVAEFVALL